MPKPDLILGYEGRSAMLRGFASIANLAALTLGPIGGNIANYQDAGSKTEILSDAATIARRIIELPERTENAGAMLMRHVVWHMRQQVGDGSATTAVLALAAAKEMQHIITAGANAMMVKRGVEKATRRALEVLDELAAPLEGEDRIAAVATAASGNEEIGRLLGEIYDVLGPNANIVTAPYIATHHDRVYREGARFRGGYISPYFVTDSTRRLAILENPYILVTDLAFESAQAVGRLLQTVFQAGGKSMLLICKRMTEKPIGVMVSNSEEGRLQSCAANIKPVGDVRRGTVENMALLTGGVALNENANIALEDIRLSDFGRADRVVVAKDHYMIIGGQGDRAAIRERNRELRSRLRSTQDREERESLRELLGQFSEGVAELRIGALTGQERTQLTETAEQAMKTVDAGMTGGIVPGGGAAYLSCIPVIAELESSLSGDEAFGARVVIKALEAPMRQIAKNAGLHPPLVLAEVRRAGDGYGYNVNKDQVANMIDDGIADPVIVTRRALQEGISGALMLLTTDALVLHKKPEESLEP